MEIPENVVIQLPKQFGNEFRVLAQTKVPEFVVIGLPEKLPEELLPTRLPDFPATNWNCARMEVLFIIHQGLTVQSAELFESDFMTVAVSLVF